MILKYFDKAYYINRDSRTDRRETFEKRTQDFPFEIERFSAIEVEPQDNELGKYALQGCTKSHIEIVRLAKEQGLNSVLIFEDDCLFAKDFVEKATSVANDLHNKEWDLFYLGGEPNGECIPITERLRLATNGMYQTHAYAIHNRFYDKILNINPEKSVIDIWYIHEKSIKLMSEKLLVKQDASFSDSMQQETKFDYTESYQKYIK